VNAVTDGGVDNLEKTRWGEKKESTKTGMGGETERNLAPHLEERWSR